MRLRYVTLLEPNVNKRTVINLFHNHYAIIYIFTVVSFKINAYIKYIW